MAINIFFRATPELSNCRISSRQRTKRILIHRVSLLSLPCCCNSQPNKSALITAEKQNKKNEVRHFQVVLNCLHDTGTRRGERQRSDLLAGLIDTGPAFNGVIVSQFRVTVTKTHHRTDAIIVCDFKPVRMAYSDEGKLRVDTSSLYEKNKTLAIHPLPRLMKQIEQ
ncbi:hypothetical protein OUZ56_002269 [Daphnia magna]|uniref:Uncharacterized protein n=1 Tax=Daphnia magna TaxID=35525 RepID=A0ABR0A560_9CRUS|nr:hypothetical protein OUZ56_002269 [Daphnia magna]